MKRGPEKKRCRVCKAGIEESLESGSGDTGFSIQDSLYSGHGRSMLLCERLFTHGLGMGSYRRVQGNEAPECLTYTSLFSAGKSE
jgi:hypothetical protein